MHIRSNLKSTELNEQEKNKLNKSNRIMSCIMSNEFKPNQPTQIKPCQIKSN